MDSRKIIQLSKKYGEAFYILDSEQFRVNFKDLEAAFMAFYPSFNIAYSYKTNYTPKLCKIINDLGGYAEVVSEMELEIAKHIGVPIERIIWNGPIKNKEVLANYVLSGGTVNVDSLPEMQFLVKIAKENGAATLSVGIRCNYDIGDGVVSRFGIDVDSDDFKQVLQLIADNKNITLKQLQCHFATRQINHWAAKVHGMLSVIDRFQIIPERIDLGGGLYGKMPETLKKQFSAYIPSYREYADVVAKPFAEYFENKQTKPELVIEPGSALVGDCMYFVGTVKSVKEVRGKYYATILASQKNISMVNVNPPMEVLKVGSDRKYYSDIDLVGYTCIEGDVLYHHFEGELSVGDLVVFGNCGSYSIVMKPPFILPNFPILDISNGEVEAIKQAETFDDLFRTFVF